MKKIAYFAIPTLLTNICFASLDDATRNFSTELELTKNSSNEQEKQTHHEKAKEEARNLLGLISGINISFSEKISGFRKILKTKSQELELQKNSDNKKVALKANRDISNFKEISKFLGCCSKTLDALYQQPELLNLIMEKLAAFIPQIGSELTIVLRALELILKNPEEKFDEIIGKMRDFAKQSDDGSYLLSPLLSAIMQQDDDWNLETILKETDFTNLDNCVYLKIK